MVLTIAGTIGIFFPVCKVHHGRSPRCASGAASTQRHKHNASDTLQKGCADCCVASRLTVDSSITVHVRCCGAANVRSCLPRTQMPREFKMLSAVVRRRLFFDSRGSFLFGNSGVTLNRAYRMLDPCRLFAQLGQSMYLGWLTPVRSDYKAHKWALLLLSSYAGPISVTVHTFLVHLVGQTTCVRAHVHVT